MTVVIDDGTAYDYFKAHQDEIRQVRQLWSELVSKIGYIFLRARQKRILDAREYKLLCMRFGTGKYYRHTHTLEQVAVELNVTRDRVRQIEARALSKLAKIHHSEVEYDGR